MGILDDAIKQHLDLKRRQGAADDEIQRLEDEAFGPPSRPGEPDFPETGEGQTLAPETGESPVASVEAPAEAEASEQTFFDHAAGGPPEQPAAESPEPPSEEVIAEVPFEIDDPAAHLEVLAEPATSDEPAVGEPPIESLDTVEHPFEDAVEETGEGDVVQAEPVEPEHTDEHPVTDGEEDVLEETPEFLRDQPEDDELWFEQGEPKDFDF